MDLEHDNETKTKEGWEKGIYFKISAEREAQLGISRKGKNHKSYIILHDEVIKKRKAKKAIEEDLTILDIIKNIVNKAREISKPKEEYFCPRLIAKSNILEINAAFTASKEGDLITQYQKVLRDSKRTLKKLPNPFYVTDLMKASSLPRAALGGRDKTRAQSEYLICEGKIKKIQQGAEDGNKRANRYIKCEKPKRCMHWKQVKDQKGLWNCEFKGKFIRHKKGADLPEIKKEYYYE
jgi:hypothetical protein